LVGFLPGTAGRPGGPWTATARPASIEFRTARRGRDGRSLAWGLFVHGEIAPTLECHPTRRSGRSDPTTRSRTTPHARPATRTSSRSSSTAST
jgi:hypothetical protein